MPDLTIVIVTWNALKHIHDCLRSIEPSSMHCEVRTVVVDNGSTDGTPDHIAGSHPGVDLIRNRENIGFASANNLAIGMSQSRYILLLNPDTSVLPGTIDRLVAFMDSHPEVSAAGPMLMNSDRTLQQSGVRFPTNWNIFVETLFLDRMFPRSRIFGGHKELYADVSRPREVEFVHGAALMARREAVEHIGGLDQRFFMYFEETDLCWRMKAAGGIVSYSAVEGIVHHGGSGAGHYDERRIVHYHVSLLRFYDKHYTTLRLMILRPILVLRSFIRILAWRVLSMAKPDRREIAKSCIRGYLGVLQMVLKNVPPVEIPAGVA